MSRRAIRERREGLAASLEALANWITAFSDKDEYDGWIHGESARQMMQFTRQMATFGEVPESLVDHFTWALQYAGGEVAWSDEFPVAERADFVRDIGDVLVRTFWHRSQESGALYMFWYSFLDAYDRRERPVEAAEVASTLRGVLLAQAALDHEHLRHSAEHGLEHLNDETGWIEAKQFITRLGCADD